MIKIEHTNVYGWDAAIRGMRNPKNSWDKIDSHIHIKTGCYTCKHGEFDSYCGNHILSNGFTCIKIGNNDLKLMKTLSKAGNDHAKYLRFIDVTCDITAPLYWWKEYDTYKVGTVANSCSTMHKIQAKEFELDDFSHEHLKDFGGYNNEALFLTGLQATIADLNTARKLYLHTGDKQYWWQMIQLLPSSYNQKRTIKLNYQVLKSMYFARKGHKLDEWHDFCRWCESLPYFKEICIEPMEDKDK